MELEGIEETWVAAFGDHRRVEGEEEGAGEEAGRFGMLETIASQHIVQDGWK